MAADKKNSGNPIPIPQSFYTQLVFGLFLTIILRILLGQQYLSLSIFLGIVGGFSIGAFSTTTKTGPQTPTVASSEGIDAGLKYWLFFMLGFVLLGYQPTTSILLGAIGGVGGGFTVAWWGAKEETRTQLPEVDAEESEDAQPGDRTVGFSI
jgi:hypothetical protein